MNSGRSHSGREREGERFDIVEAQTTEANDSHRSGRGQVSPDHELQRIVLWGFCGKKFSESSEAPKAKMIKGR
jgi:hypothetical protein